MDISVFSFEIVISRTGSQITWLVYINAEVLSHYRPDSEVELATLEKKRVLNIFLNDPALRLRILCKDELIDITQVPEEFDSFPLIQRSWLDEPHVLLTVLDWDSLLIRATAANFLVTSHQQVDFIVITDL